jgi:cytoskeletal protein CcmA (bactofilin family)
MFHLAGGGQVPAAFGGTDLLASGPLSLPEAGRSGGRLFSAAELRIGAGAEVFEAHAGGVLKLGAASRLLWWGTGSRIELGRHAQAVGALRAESEIVLEPGASFLYLRAQRIVASSTASEASALDRPDPPERQAPGPRQVFEGNHQIAAGQAVQGDLIVRGDLRVGEGARIAGSIKAHGSVALGAGTRVDGAVVADVGVQLGDRVRVGGCVLGERWVALGTGSRVGAPGSSATVSGETVKLSPGAEVYGMIRAWKGGYVSQS